MATETDVRPMDDKQRNILRRCKATLVKDMDPDEVLLQMADSLLFTTEDENKIKSMVTRQQQCETLLEMLQRKGAKAYEIFKKTLENVHPHLARTIVEAENKELNYELRLERENSADLRRRLAYTKVKRGTPRDDELEKLSMDIGDIWKKLGLRLYVTDAKQKEIDRAHELLSEKAYYTLKHWKQSKGAAANYQALCDALQDEGVERQDLVEKYCYIKEKEFDVLQTDLESTRTHSAETRRIVGDMATGSGQTLEEKFQILHELVKEKADSNAIETRLQEIETSVKQLKDIQKSMKNSVKDEEEEPDDSRVSLDRQKNARFLERATSPNQSESEGNQICSRCHKLEEEFDAHNQEKNALAAKGQKREAVLSQTYPMINCVRVNDLEQVIENLRQEKRDMESRLLREKNKLVGDLQGRQKSLVTVQRKNSKLTTQNGHLEEMNEKLKKKNSELKLKIKTGECETNECDERKAESNRRTSSEIELLRKTNESLIKENKDFIQKIKDLEENMNELKRTNEIVSSKTRTAECETSECAKLKAELNLLSSERERLRKEVANANADSLQKTEALETKNKRLQTKLETKESEKCKILEEVNKYKNAVCRAFLPSGKEFISPIGVLSTLSRDRSAKIVATRSSEGPGEASDIFDHSKGKESGTAELRGSWWKVDLGENHRVAITHYALRHGKRDGESILRKWELQGSIDGLNWMDLEYAQDPRDPPQFCDPSPYYTGRWSIVCEVRAFRYFRILQTGTNSAGRYGIYLSGLELYGTLLEL